MDRHLKYGVFGDAPLPNLRLPMKTDDLRSLNYYDYPYQGPIFQKSLQHHIPQICTSNDNGIYVFILFTYTHVCIGSPLKPYQAGLDAVQGVAVGGYWMDTQGPNTSQVLVATNLLFCIADSPKSPVPCVIMVVSKIKGLEIWISKHLQFLKPLFAAAQQSDVAAPRRLRSKSSAVLSKRNGSSRRASCACGSSGTFGLHQLRSFQGFVPLPVEISSPHPVIRFL